MGYSHYWYLNKKGDDKEYQKALSVIKSMISQNLDVLGNGIGEPIKKIEDAIVSVVDDYKYENGTEFLRFNGLGDKGCETVSLPLSLSALSKIKVDAPSFGQDDGYVFDCCKTRYNAYDKYVIATLMILKHFLKKDVRISSDGEYLDSFIDGWRLANQLLPEEEVHYSFDRSNEEYEEEDGEGNLYMNRPYELPSIVSGDSIENGVLEYENGQIEYKEFFYKILAPEKMVLKRRNKFLEETEASLDE